MSVLGFSDPWIWGVYVLCVVSAVACVLYGWANWNKGDEAARPEDVRWVKDEKEIEEDL